MLNEHIKARLEAIHQDGERQMIALGKECAVFLSGFEEDADRTTDLESAFQAITMAVDTNSSASAALDKDRIKGDASC